MNPVVKTIVDIIYEGLEYFNRYYSEYRAIVVDRDDPLKAGRLRLLIPGISDEPLEQWVYSAGVYAGPGYGLKLIPPVDSVVYVIFENGDPNKPLWKHGYFADNEIPESLSHPDQYWLLTPNGMIIEMNDKDNYIKIEHNKGDVVTLNDNGISIESKKINLGTTDKQKEPAVMGETLEKLLKDLIDQNNKVIDEVNNLRAETVKALNSLTTPADLTNIYTAALAVNMKAQATSYQASTTQVQLSLEATKKELTAIKDTTSKIKSKKVGLDYE